MIKIVKRFSLWLIEITSRNAMMTIIIAKKCVRSFVAIRRRRINIENTIANINIISNIAISVFVVNRKDGRQSINAFKIKSSGSTTWANAQAATTLYGNLRLPVSSMQRSIS
uniref:Uncharacterized protein n=1 Tax=Romanomermis culicivorax TaxID=13658 RepID=A0A915HQY2_ROMCU